MKRVIEAGDTLAGTWGYDQTNASFYRVVKVAGTMATLQKLLTHNTWQGDTMTGTAVPGGDDPDEKPIRRKVLKPSPRYPDDAECCRIADFGPWVKPWDGAPVKVTCYG